MSVRFLIIPVILCFCTIINAAEVCLSSDELESILKDAIFNLKTSGEEKGFQFEKLPDGRLKVSGSPEGTIKAYQLLFSRADIKLQLEDQKIKVSFNPGDIDFDLDSKIGPIKLEGKKKMAFHFSFPIEINPETKKPYISSLRPKVYIDPKAIKLKETGHENTWERIKKELERNSKAALVRMGFISTLKDEIKKVLKDNINPLCQTQLRELLVGEKGIKIITGGKKKECEEDPNKSASIEIPKEGFASSLSDKDIEDLVKEFVKANKGNWIFPDGTKLKLKVPPQIYIIDGKVFISLNGSIKADPNKIIRRRRSGRHIRLKDITKINTTYAKITGQLKLDIKDGKFSMALSDIHKMDLIAGNTYSKGYAGLGFDKLLHIKTKHTLKTPKTYKTLREELEDRENIASTTVESLLSTSEFNSIVRNMWKKYLIPRKPIPVLWGGKLYLGRSTFGINYRGNIVLSLKDALHIDSSGNTSGELSATLDIEPVLNKSGNLDFRVKSMRGLTYFSLPDNGIAKSKGLLSNIWSMVKFGVVNAGTYTGGPVKSARNWLGKQVINYLQRNNTPLFSVPTKSGFLKSIFNPNLPYLGADLQVDAAYFKYGIIRMKSTMKSNPGKATKPFYTTDLNSEVLKKNIAAAVKAEYSEAASSSIQGLISNIQLGDLEVKGNSVIIRAKRKKTE